MPDVELADAAEKTTLFARLTPAHKQRIVRLLRSKGHVVGFMGDGINDAPALHAADIGISVDTAVDIAKESADLILLEKDLMVLDGGVIEGRKVFANIIKYIRMGASSNFGNMFSVLGASAFLPFIPMAPFKSLATTCSTTFLKCPSPPTWWTRNRLRIRGRGTSERSGGSFSALDPSARSSTTPLSCHALSFQVLGCFSCSVISDRLVRRVADDADSHYPYHSHE